MGENTLMQEVIKVAGTLKGSKLKNLTKIEPVMETIKQKVQLATREEVIILMAIFDRQCSNKQSNLDDLSNYFQCTSMEIMALVPAIKSLMSKGYIRTVDKEKEITKMTFMVCPDIFTAIVEGGDICPIPVENTKKFDQFVFCDTVHEMIEERSNNHISTKELFVRTERLENEHPEIAMVKELKKQITDIDARTWFYEMCHDFSKSYSGGKTGLDCTLEDIYDKFAEGIICKEQILNYSHPLIKANLIELSVSIGDEKELCLTKAGITLFLEKNASVYTSDICNDRYMFINKLANLVDESSRTYSYEFYSLYRKVENLENCNKHLTFITNVQTILSEPQDRLIYYFVCKEAIDLDTYSLRGLEYLFEKQEELKAKRLLKEKKHPLQKLGLVELTKTTGFFESTELQLTEKGKELFFEEDIDLFEEKVDDNDMIDSAKIVEKRLFFEPSLEKQLATLKKSLEESNFTAMRKRLKANNLPTGIAVLLYGLPGTGKTESVMQIARATGRSVMHVDISETKTCWFGESEKLIKKVFTNYRKLCEKSKVKPILLFNEADAVFSKRKDSNSSSVAQTENAIQNIILEEIENLDGILIATTNLASNLDKAFERRFLFKIYFDKPTTESKICIWKDKMPSLTDDEARHLATTFDFNGGEIDNIVRKVTMEEVIGGNHPDMVRMMTICGEERIATANKKIGF